MFNRSLIRRGGELQDFAFFEEAGQGQQRESVAVLGQDLRVSEGLLHRGGSHSLQVRGQVAP